MGGHRVTAPLEDMRSKLAAAAIAALSITLAQPPAPRSVWDGVYTAEQAKRGEGRYNQLCASCHGDSLGGGESAPPLAGGEFLANWNGLTVGDLFERTRKTMPQSKPGSLTREQNAEILAYVFSANRFPAGKTELERATEVLMEIRIEANKPEGKK
jgi:mono/diheme cytochrome c family protein